MGATKKDFMEIREKEYFQLMTEEEFWQEVQLKFGRWQTAIMKAETLKKEKDGKNT